MFKQCSKCKKVLPIANFCKASKNKDGLSSCCKKCKKNQDKIYREKNKAKIRAKKQEYWLSDKGKKNSRISHNKRRFGLNADDFVKGKCCEFCGITNYEHKIKYNERLHIDHINNQGRKNQRLGLKPDNRIENLQILCRSCHVIKDNKNKDYSFKRKKVFDKKTNKVFGSLVEAAKHYNITPVAVGHYVKGRIKNKEKYDFCYFTDVKNLQTKLLNYEQKNSKANSN